MRLKVLAVILLAPFALAGTAQATVISGFEAPTIQYWTDLSKMPTPPEPVEIQQTSESLCHSDLWACAVSPTEIAMPEMRRPKEWRLTFLHELGHVFDWQVLTDEDRADFLRLLGLEGRPWDFEVPGIDIHDTSPREFFAEAYAECAMNGVRLTRAVKAEVLPMHIGVFISLSHYEAICRLIMQSAA